MSFGGGSSGGSTTTQVTPYAPAEPALAQILSEAQQLYGQGVGASGYVPPTQQTLTGLAGQEALGTAAQQQMAATLGGQYLNPFLSPLIQKTAADVSTGHYDVNFTNNMNSTAYCPVSNIHYSGLLAHDQYSRYSAPSNLATSSYRIAGQYVNASNEDGYFTVGTTGDLA